MGVHEAGERVDRYVAERSTLLPTRSSARKGLRRGLVQVDGVEVEPSRRVRVGMVVTVRESLGTARVLPLALRVLYADPWLAVVVKPPGLPVNGNRHRTLEHALPHNLDPSTAEDAVLPRPVHRLDARTGGLVVVARAAAAMVALGWAFQERRVHKEYRAVVLGRLDGAGAVRLPLDGRAAWTRWEALRPVRSLRSAWLTEVRLHPETGRTHQLRRHMSFLGHPVLGDAPYGQPGLILRGKGLFLWAVGVRLRHPVTGEDLDLATDPPPRFSTHLAREARRWRRVHGGGDGVVVPGR